MSNLERNPGGFPEPVPGGDKDTRRRGLLRLFPQWLTRNSRWHLDVVDWLGTKQGHDELRTMFDTFHAVQAVGFLTMEQSEVSEPFLLENAVTIAREKKYIGDESDDEYREMLKKSLMAAIKNGSVVKKGDNLSLSERQETLFIMTEAMSRAFHEEDTTDENSQE